MLIKLQNIIKDYRMGPNTYRALKGVDLEIDKGEFVAIMGSSGSGKSTMMNIIGALDVPTDGEYILNNTNIKELSDSDLAHFRNKEIGFVFQQFNLLKSQSVHNNVALPGKYGQLPDLHKRVEEVLAAVGLQDKQQNKPNQLSGGQIQRVAVARALVMSPTLILADEPTGNLDTKTGDSIMDLFTEIHNQGNTIVMVTHEDNIAAYAERVVTLKDGVVISDKKNRKNTTKEDKKS